MKILFLSHSPQGEYFRVGSHHLAREFGNLGHRVLHVSTPKSKVHQLRDFLKKVDRKSGTQGSFVDGNVTHVTYETNLPIAWSRSRRIFASTLARFDMEEPDLVLIDQPLMDYTDSFTNAIMVYRPTDIHPSGPKRRRELGLLTKVDVVVATSQVVLDSLPGLEGSRSTVLENGVEAKRFVADASGPARLGAIYVGAIDHRFDWDAVNEIARSLDPEPVTLVGPPPIVVPRIERNVVVAGPMPYETIPEIVGRARVGLLPFNAHELNSSRSPMKFYEYLAAGLYVVGRSTAPLRARSAPGVFLYDKVEDIHTLMDKIPEASSINGGGRLEAMRFDWSSRAAELLEFVVNGRVTQ
jgi:teichuronic acid biosynthesis glycosyltransferase TuaH